MQEYVPFTPGQRNPLYVRDHGARLDNNLLPFFGKLCLSAVTAGKVQEYPVTPHGAKPQHPAPRTVTLRQVMKTALRHDWISHPDFSAPYRASGKIGHRAWFSAEEYKRLYTHTRERIKTAKGMPWEYPLEQMQTTSCSWPTPACGPTKRTGWSTVT